MRGLGFLLLLLLAGCTAARPPGPALPPAAVEELQAILAARREAIRSLRSQASIAISSPERNAKASQFLVVERPDRLRVEVFSPFGIAFALTAADGELAAYIREQNRVFRGAATPENLGRYTSLDLQVSDVVDVVLGGAPPRKVESASVFVETATGRLRLRQETGQGAQVVLFAGDTRLPLAIEELDDDGTLLWRASFADYRGAPSPVATRIGLELPAAEQTVEIVLDDPEVNPSLPASLFSLPTPSGAQEVDL